jgi:hypothetical protein
VLVIETSNCILYETGNAYPQNGGANWIGYSGIKWDQKFHALRPGLTSSDAAGFASLRAWHVWEEVAAGEIVDALPHTLPSMRRDLYQWPATHWASNLADNVNNLMTGLLFRLKASFDISGTTITH